MISSELEKCTKWKTINQFAQKKEKQSITMLSHFDQPTQHIKHFPSFILRERKKIILMLFISIIIIIIKLFFSIINGNLRASFIFKSRKNNNNLTIQ